MPTASTGLAAGEGTALSLARTEPSRRSAEVRSQPPAPPPAPCPASLSEGRSASPWRSLGPQGEALGKGRGGALAPALPRC